MVYSGQYDVQLPINSVEANEEDKITKLWSRTLPQLLLAPSEAEFDEILQEFVMQREELGFDEVQQKKTEMMIEAKEKLGIQ